MDNQHEKITGYRDLSQLEIDLMNLIKSQGEELKNMLQLLAETDGTDKRWINIAKTDLQKGIMAAVRSVAKPTSF